MHILTAIGGKKDIPILNNSDIDIISYYDIKIYCNIKWWDKMLN